MAMTHRDTDTIADTAMAATLHTVFEEQRRAFARHGAPSRAHRKAMLLKLEVMLSRSRRAISEALIEDFGCRSPHETQIAEVVGSLHSIRFARRHLGSWMRPRRRSTSIWFLPGSNRVLAQPKGVVGIMSPWNYPVHLTIAPLVAAVAAGNRVMVKMSEATPATAALMGRLIGECFGRDEVCVVRGEVDVSRTFAALPFDHLLFTGSTEVGRKVATSAAINLTPVTLELSGKSPVVIDSDYPLDQAAMRTVWGKLFNAGQTCIAPDYVLVPSGREAEFSQLAREAARKLYPTFVDNPQYTSVINESHFRRLRRLIDDARSKGAVIEPATDLDGGAAVRKLPLTVIREVTPGMSVLEEEIFGPVLPVLGYRSIDDAIRYINLGSRPLALYLFTNSGSTRRRMLGLTTSGGVTVNDTLLHYLQDDLPFGGSGESGMGAYHGKEGFDTFSHQKAVFTQHGVGAMTGAQLLYPPYGRIAEALIRAMRRI